MSIATPPELRKTRLVCLSDTHGASPRDGAFKLPKGDVLIHAGDLTNQGTYAELEKTVSWLAAAPYEVKIVIAGNHDITLDKHFYAAHGGKFHNQRPEDPAACLALLTSPAAKAEGIIYLAHEPASVRLTSPAGPQTAFTVFGSPYSPARGTWAFGYDPPAAEELWTAIPTDTDVVIAHTPGAGHLDVHPRHGSVGCAALQRRLWGVRPRVLVHGHVHEGRGAEVIRWGQGWAGREEGLEVWDGRGVVGIPARAERETTGVVNAAIMGRSWGLGAKRFNQPVVVDVLLPAWQPAMEQRMA